MSVVIEAREPEHPSTRAPEHLRTRAPEHLNVGLLGFGRVGQAVAELAADAGDRLEAAGIELAIAGALVRDRAKPRRRADVALCDDPARFFDRHFDVVIEVIGGVNPAYDYVRRALEARVPVVTANKSLMAAKGEELRELARTAGVPLAYDAAVLAGVPFLGAIARRPFVGAPGRITGILNGTSHFLTCALANGRSFDGALKDAIDHGYAEPDSAADVSGRDAAEKLTILAHLCGCRDLRPLDLTTMGIDALGAADFSAAPALGGVIKPIASASLDPRNPGAWVGPALIDLHHPAASSTGVHNFLELRHLWHGGIDIAPVTFAGPGAGPSVTAATILDDVAEVVSGAWRVRQPLAHAVVKSRDLRRPAASSWYLRVRDASLTIEDLAEYLAVHRVPAVRLARVNGVLAARTSVAPWSLAADAAGSLAALGADVLLIPVIEATDERG